MNGNNNDKDAQLELRICQYLDGELSESEARAFERMVERDGELQERLRRYALLNKHLDALGEEGAEGVDLEAQRVEVMARLERRALLGVPQRRLIFRGVFWGAAAAAAVVVAAVTAWVVWSPPPKEGPMVTVAWSQPQRGEGPQVMESSLVRVVPDPGGTAEMGFPPPSVGSPEAVEETIVFEPSAPPGDEEIAQVWSPPGAEMQLSVAAPRLRWDQLRLGADARRAPPVDVPPGTVMVAVARRGYGQMDAMAMLFPLNAH